MKFELKSSSGVKFPDKNQTENQSFNNWFGDSTVSAGRRCDYEVGSVPLRKHTKNFPSNWS